MQTAIGKERFKYFSGFYAVCCFFLPIGAFKTHNPKIIMPLAPLSIIMAYQYDLYYGNL